MALDPEARYESRLYGGFRNTAAREWAIAKVAARQHGVLGVPQLEELGLSANAAQKRAAQARLHRIYRGVYALAPRSLLAREGHWMAAVLAGPPGAVLSHRSAAALHRLRPHGSSRIELTVPALSARPREGLRIHRSSTLTATDTTKVDGIPCTTVARTLLDLATVLHRRGLERACDQAEIEEAFDLAALTDVLARNRHHPGARKLTAVLEEHYIGQTPTANGLEEAFFAICRRAGLPLPEVNVMLDLGDGDAPITVDFLWRRERLAVETDGRRTHGTVQAFERDRRRDQRLTVARWHPLRFPKRQVFRRPAEVQRTLTAVFRRLSAA